jgi:ferredoxin
MNPNARRAIFVCTCERTMPAYGEAVAKTCGGARLEEGDQFCGAGLDRFRDALGRFDAITVGCTQQAPLFTEVAEDAAFAGTLSFANIRENGGWSVEAAEAGPKAAAILAAAAEPIDPPFAVQLKSEGVVLIYGVDETAIEAGRMLADKLDVTVLLAPGVEIVPHAVWDFPVLQGRVRNAAGYLGAFEVVVDDFAAPLPSSRTSFRFGAGRDGAVSTCDIFLDLSGGTSLFPADHVRDGYIRADPRDRATLATALMKAGDLVGEFDKPRYVDYRADLCAHSRSRKIGCTRCLDLCPTGAIVPAGDHVAISAEICAGCGNCAAVCPTGAAAYALPAAEQHLRKVRTLVRTYAEAGGREAVVLFHDESNGADLIEALGRFGDGLPANVLPVAVNEISALGPEAWTAPLAWGAAAVRAITRAKPRLDVLGLARTVALANCLSDALGYGEERCAIIATDDPDDLRAQLEKVAPGTVSQNPSGFLPVGRKRSVLESTMIELFRAAPTPAEDIALPPLSPFGTLDVDVAGCTLCLSCVGVCPTAALSDSPDKPALYFSESACVQCGLCASTCPEKVITLRPRLSVPAWSERKRVIKEEEPFHCIACGTAFGTKSTVERIVAKLEGTHWMYSGANAPRLDIVRMCDKCRVEAVTNQGFDPYASTARPAPRTTEDYLREREAGGRDPV